MESTHFHKVRELSSVVFLEENLHAGRRLEKTIDLFSLIGMCVMVHSDPMVLSNDLDQIRSMEHNGALFALANWVGWTWRSSKWDVPKSVMRGWCGIPWCTACSSTHVFIVLHYARWSCLFCSPFDYPIESVSWDGDVFQVSESKIAHRLEGGDTTLHWFLHLHFLMTQVVRSVRKQTFERKQRRITAWISTSDAMIYWFYGCSWLWRLQQKSF